MNSAITATNAVTFLVYAALTGATFLLPVMLQVVWGYYPLASGLARAETIELVDKTKLNGKVIHYYDGVYSIEANGQTIKLPKEKIRSISFTPPAARPEFSTPENTF